MVAVITQQASYDASLVVVVDMKVATTTGVGGLADSALAVLLGEQGFVGAQRGFVAGSDGMVLGQAWIGGSPLLGCFAAVGEVLFAPFFVALARALLAIHRQTMNGVFAGVKLIAQLGLSATRASLGDRHVERFSSHRESNTSLLLSCQGG